MADSRLSEVADRTWVGVAPLLGAQGPPHPADAAAAAAMAPWRAGEFLAGRHLLRAALRELFPRAADSGVRAGENGKPYLADRHDLGISISHDGGVVAVCVAEGRAVGVDVQQPPAALHRALARRCLRGAAAELDRLPERAAAAELAWVWTVQESCVKATGEGMSGCPWSIDVPSGRGRGRWGDYEWVSLREQSAVPLSCAFGPPKEET
ncbi:4'-phosphopantetheinyl transferase family protein [Actinokineospora sp. G85]|uniref:4'-phosphopantetheinyl transferase family protein n=1 Tax=Actinokineospora sp. G85 TaxID=3406626 RepID=UPI003C795B1E